MQISEADTDALMEFFRCLAASDIVRVMSWQSASGDRVYHPQIAKTVDAIENFKQQVLTKPTIHLERA